MSAVAEAWIDLLHHHGAHLLPLRKRVKEPVNRAWPDVMVVSRWPIRMDSGRSLSYHSCMTGL